MKRTGVQHAVAVAVGGGRRVLENLKAADAAIVQGPSSCAPHARTEMGAVRPSVRS